MFFRKKSPVKKIDKLVTGLIIWWAVASILWLSKKKKTIEIANNIKNESTSLFKKGFSFLWKGIVWILRLFNKK